MPAQARRPPHHSNSQGTAFANPWDEPKDVSFDQWSLPSFLANGWAGFPFEWAKAHPGHPHKPIEVVKPNFDYDHASMKDELQATWLGHASFLVTLPLDEAGSQPIRILYDPMFSDRAGPSQWTGPRRSAPPPCTVNDLPDFHFVVISHNHYDHLDLGSIQSIMSTRGENVHYIVPLGNKAWFLACGIADGQITELDWWKEVSLPASGKGSPDSRSVKFVCTPAQHNSGRGMTDHGATLWASWVTEYSMRRAKEDNENKRVAVYFAGDTGYMTSSGPCPAFKEIGEKYGPFDLALLPIWRGGTLQFVARMGLRLTDHKLTSSVHATPSQALAIHQDIKSRHSLAMHFATFAGSDIEAFEPIVELTQEREQLSIGDWAEDGGFGVIDIGETARIPL